MEPPPGTLSRSARGKAGRSSEDSSETRARVAPIVVGVLVALLAALPFLPALQGEFVTWDDNRNFLDNVHYRGLGWTQLRWMWTTFHMGHYIPISWMTLGLDYVLWGMNPAGYHAVNLVLHSANAVLVYVIARRLLSLTGAIPPQAAAFEQALPAAAAALLFALHPLRVESVAWITERRDMLSLVFYQTSFLFYLRAVEEGSHRRRDYWIAVGVFVLALLSKGTSVTLPALLLIVNVYPLRRLPGDGNARGVERWWSANSRRVLAEMVPFAALAMAASALTIVALHPPHQLNFAGKIAVSAYSLAFYLWKTIAPTGLAPLYEMPQDVNPVDARYLISGVFVLALTVWAWTVRHRRPGVTTAWFAFLAIILPMLGIVQNGPQIAADRYTYHAAPVLAILAGAGIALARRWSPVVRSAVAGIAIAILGLATWRQTLIWRTSERLWSRVIELDPRSSIGQIAMGDVVIKQNRVEEAIEHYGKGVEVDPEYAEGHNNLGVALARQGRLPEAIDRYRRALALKPSLSDAHNNWGIALGQQGRIDDAMAHYRTAVEIDPDNADAQNNWGNALVRLGRPGEAIEHYREAVRARPDRADPHVNWGVALIQQGYLDEAIVHFQLAVTMDSRHADARAYYERAVRLREQRTGGRSP